MVPIPHIVAIPYPAQGHVLPLMELSLWLVKEGCKITFVNSEFNHKRVIKALSENKDVQKKISLVSIPDGLGAEEDRTDLKKLTEAIAEVMPGKLEEVIKMINESDENGVSCVIVDENMGWALGVAEKLNIRRVAFWPAAAATLASLFSVSKLIDDGIIDSDGTILRKQGIKLSPNMPIMNPSDFAWACFPDPAMRKLIIELVKDNNERVKSADWIICNSAEELEPGAFAMFPQVLPIGPLLASNRLGSSAGHFWPEDSNCLKWLDLQPLNSVIYVAFGSLTILDSIQFQELALGLELSKRRFLWVVRENLLTEEAADNAYPKGFKDRISNRGHIVKWAPQQQVLAHPSIACFLSHCGWNSTVESVSNGVPFLCWPYFADQLFNQSYICDVWKVGLGFKKNEFGIIGKEEIKNKMDQLFGDEAFKERALDLQAKVKSSVKGGGSSNKMFGKFIDWIKTAQ
ncbi:PREDICTED: UDP-glycosyltransferase 83A1-like [Nicotiana attenuata]|uniref:UDP-glycosyltransferase g10741 n=1 Tax=Nicotiana attenuata TaxID=49451 RepID=A0A1J6IZ64_NICAT|nr:PREDICTED: UDP-glycosyltransferase 83A1-like [Nicotiana attenuata]AQQ16644.1 UDP-glycosyltransferase g10741 [Nicotiana attenuata]OIT05832.1 udp-glycosyltransferase 83a1 [Nicotiana attenuata]